MRNKILSVFLILFSVNSLCQRIIDYTPFDNANLNGWMLINGSETNKLAIGAAKSYYAPFSRIGVYISNDNGVTNSYDNITPSIVHMQKFFPVIDVTNDLVLSYKLSCNGDPNFDYVSVFLPPTNLTPQPGEAINPVYLIGKSEYSGKDYWQGESIKIDKDLITENFISIVFSWSNDGNGIGSSPAAIDNICLSELNMPQGNWTEKSYLFPRYYGGSSTSGYSHFISGGDISSGIGTSQFLEYDFFRDTYSDLPIMLKPVRLNQSLSLSGRYISDGGIYNSSSEPTNEIHSFNFKNFIWTLEDTLPKKTIYSRLTLYNDNIYKIGGSDQTNTLLNNVYYSETGFNWNEATSIPSDGVADGALTLVLTPDEIECGEIIYVGGFRNFDFRVQVDSVWVGCINPDDPSIIKWESRSNFPGGSRARFQAFPWGQNKVMVIGGAAGEDFNNLFKDVWLYDVIDDSWTQLDDFPIEICAYMGGSIQLTDNLWAAVIAGGVTTGQVISNKTFVYFDTLETVTSVEIINDRVPNSYFLMQNYPNPFNPSTTIRFSLPKESYTKLEIFNALGEKVSTLVSETLSSGTYEYEWDAAGLSSGVYFYRLTTESFNQTKKLLLMK